MDTMKINVARELKLIGEVGTSHLSVNMEKISYYGRELEFVSPVKIDVNYSYDGNCFNVNGTVKAVLKSECALCLKEFDEPYEFGFEETFAKEQQDADDEVYLFSGEVLDLSTMITDNILLNMPIRSVCADDCKGLCPICGCNLNYTQCSCVKEESEKENPLSRLGQLLTDGEEV